MSKQKVNRLVKLWGSVWGRFAVLAVVVVVFTILGAILIKLTHAATPFVAAEAESGTVTSPASKVADGTASGSNAVQFGATSAGGKCIGSGNAPGSADPWGTCWPGPQNTGYPHGLIGDSRPAVTLTSYNGPYTISSCGTVIDSKTVNGDLTITASNGTHSAATPCVTIKNSLVMGTIYVDTINQGPVVVTDTEVAVTGGDFVWTNLGSYNTFITRVDSHGGLGTLKCSGYCEAHDTWVHGMYLDKAYHYNAFGNNGIDTAAAYFTIDHSYADCGGFAGKSAGATSGAGCSADIGFYGDFAPVRNITINHVFFAPSVETAQYPGYTQPGYCLNPGWNAGKTYPTPSNEVVTNNIFARGPNGKCGSYGPEGGWYTGSGNVWGGNKWDDGTALDR